MCRLRCLLLESGPHGGVLADDGGSGSGGGGGTYTLSSLRRLVQASDGELLAQLHAIAAYEVDGHYRLLRDEYAQSLVQDVLNAVIETRQPAHRVHTATVVATVQHLHPPAIAQQCLHTLAPYSPQQPHSDDEHIALCPERLSRHVACSIFTAAPPASHRQPADELLRRIASALPAPLVCQPAYLLSLAVSLPATPSAPAVYRYLPAHQLPMDVKQRLSAMFAVKAKWSAEEMAAWMSDITTAAAAAEGRGGGKADGALLKHCRTQTDKEVVGGHTRQTLYYVSHAQG